jgi:DNA-binding transcriptional LysR family regulator
MLLNEMEIFYHVVDTGSFSKAADRLRVSKSFVSKKVKKLENDLNARLVYRDSRKLKLTPEGEAFYMSCSDLVAKGREGYDIVQSLRGVPSGVLKVSMSPAVTKYLIEPLLPAFLKKHPQIELHVSTESRIVDIVKEGFDVVFRSVSSLEDSSLIARRLYTYNSYICATPEFINHFGPINSTHDLENLDFVSFFNSKTLKFADNSSLNRKVTIYSDQLEFVKSMVLNNMGLGVFPDYMVRKELQDKQLVHCLEKSPLPQSTIYMVYPEKEYLSLKLRVFLDFIFEKVERLP